MTDVFRSEILAVVMQQIMDEPVLPVLFLRTVCCLSYYIVLFDLNLYPFIPGNPSRDDLQVTRWLCINNTTFSLNHQENMD
jgi:hypothetical protein